MKNTYKKISNIAILFTTLIQSCISDIKDVQPQFKKPIEAISSDISSLISYDNLSITSKKERSSDTQPTKELIIELTNPKVITYTTNDLDKLSKQIAVIVKGSILNFNSFDWLTIAYVTNDGSVVSDSTSQNAYVLRPYDIK